MPVSVVSCLRDLVLLCGSIFDHTKTRKHHGTNTGQHEFRKIALFLTLILLSACGPTREIIVVFHAGSLSQLIGKVAERFEQNHPRVLIQSESSGSLDAIRKITELNKPCDIVAVADYRLIERFLRPRITHNYIFLGNELVLATAKREMLQDLSQKSAWAENWYEKLSSRRYSYGISDPDRDPAGYYAHLCWKLAEIYYDRPGLYRRLVNGLQAQWMRPKSSELVALLQTETLEFAFLYKSTALQNNLGFVVFPTEISLVEDTYTDLYSRVFIDVAGTKPGSTFEVTGMPIRYGVALTNPANLWAQRLLDFLLSPEVQELYRELGYVNVPIAEVRQESIP